MRRLQEAEDSSQKTHDAERHTLPPSLRLWSDQTMLSGASTSVKIPSKEDKKTQKNTCEELCMAYLEEQHSFHTNSAHATLANCRSVPVPLSSRTALLPHDSQAERLARVQATPVTYLPPSQTRAPLLQLFQPPQEVLHLNLFREGDHPLLVKVRNQLWFHLVAHIANIAVLVEVLAKCRGLVTDSSHNSRLLLREREHGQKGNVVALTNGRGVVTRVLAELCLSNKHAIVDALGEGLQALRLCSRARPHNFWYVLAVF
jgi:hypothetical protein